MKSRFIATALGFALGATHLLLAADNPPIQVPIPTTPADLDGKWLAPQFVKTN